MLKLKRNVALVLMALTLSACHGYKIHPGALGTFDSTTYDTLLVTQSIIETSREQFKSGVLPDRLRPSFNKLVDTYNVAYDTFNVWRPLAEQGTPADDKLAAVKAALTAMNVAATEFKRAK